MIEETTLKLSREEIEKAIQEKHGKQWIIKTLWPKGIVLTNRLKKVPICDCECHIDQEICCQYCYIHN